MRLKRPFRNVCEKFHLTYELEGAQRAVDFLTRYYGVRRLELIVDGRKVVTTRTHKKYAAHYYKNKAYFVRRFLTKPTVLHETFHHLISAKIIDLPLGKEERMAEEFAKFVMKRKL